MPMKIERLHDNDWVSLNRMVWPEQDIHGYVFSHEKRCGGHIISILPYRSNEDNLEFLLRAEVTPCWHPTEQQISSITGGAEEGKTIQEVAVHELREEAGYIVKEENLHSLGTCYGTKSTDTVYHLFSINLTGNERIEATGDGSELEAKAHCFWDTADAIEEAVDPMVSVSFVRLLRSMKKALRKLKEAGI